MAHGCGAHAVAAQGCAAQAVAQRAGQQAVWAAHAGAALQHVAGQAV